LHLTVGDKFVRRAQLIISVQVSKQKTKY